MDSLLSIVNQYTRNVTSWFHCTTFHTVDGNSKFDRHQLIQRKAHCFFYGCSHTHFIHKKKKQVVSVILLKNQQYGHPKIMPKNLGPGPIIWWILWTPLNHWKKPGKILLLQAKCPGGSGNGSVARGELVPYQNLCIIYCSERHHT